MLSEPQDTPADLSFSLAGVRVRVSAWFWLAAALIGWNVCQAYSRGDQRALIQFLMLWVGAVFVSLLVHEFGHALAYRFFGQSAHVVLYHFGGLAVPETWGRRGYLRPFQRLVVSAAGPLAQFAFAAAIVAGLKATGTMAPFPLEVIGRPLGLYEGRGFASPFTYALADFLLYVNVFWPLINLVPVPPLDGGQIIREGLLTAGVADAHRIAGIIGVVAGGAMAWWGYTHGEPFLGIMFAMLAASCFQSLSASTPWQRWN
jgi:Zn-dependent protease